MKYYVEDSLSNFQFWSGGRDRANLLSNEQLDTVEQMLEEIAPEEGWSDTAINDFFWFEFDTIAEWLGYKSEEHLEKDISDDEIDEAQDWFDSVAKDYDFFWLAEMNVEDYIFTNDNGEEEMDYDSAYDDFVGWWNDKSDIEQVEIYRNYK